jgi:hypothetical protein
MLSFNNPKQVLHIQQILFSKASQKDETSTDDHEPTSQSIDRYSTEWLIISISYFIYIEITE